MLARDTPSRPVPWSVLVAAAVIFAGGGAFLHSLHLKPGGDTAASASSKILGLDDEATLRGHANESRAEPSVTRCKSDGCDGVAFCRPGEVLLACCAKGKSPNAAAECECAPGGSNAAGCKPPDPEYAKAFEAAFGDVRDKLKLCFKSAKLRDAAAAREIAATVKVAPDGSPYGVVVTASAGALDDKFSECAISWLESVKVPPPPDGHFEGPIAFSLE